MNRIKKAAALLEAALIALLFTGCFSYHELESLTIVTGIAIDKGAGGTKYRMTFECLNMSGGGGSEDAQTPQAVVLQSEGDSVFDAVRGVLSESSQKLYFSDCQEVILSRDIAKEGIRKVIKWFLSDAETRVTLRFVVSEEPTAAELLQQEVQTGQTPALEISGALEEAYSNSLACLPLRLYEINAILSRPGLSLTLPGVRVVREGEKSWLRLGATAVFRDDRLAGWLPEERVPYFIFVRGKVNGGLIVPGDRMPGVTFEIGENRTDLGVTFSGGVPSAEVRTETAVSADEIAAGEKNGDVGGPSFSKLQSAAEETVKAGVEGVIQYVKEKFGTDIFGFGLKISRDYPSEWEKLSKDWDKTFLRMSCRADAKVTIRDTSKLVEKELEP